MYNFLGVNMNSFQAKLIENLKISNVFKLYGLEMKKS